MNVYNKSDKDIQSIIIRKLRHCYYLDLLDNIIDLRKKKLIHYIYHLYPNITYYTEYNSKLYIWLTQNYSYHMKYINFFNKLFQCKNNNGNLKSIFYNYKQKYLGNYEHFIKFILQNLEIEELEDLYNFILDGYNQNKKVNKSILISYLNPYNNNLGILF